MNDDSKGGAEDWWEQELEEYQQTSKLRGDNIFDGDKTVEISSTSVEKYDTIDKTGDNSDENEDSELEEEMKSLTAEEMAADEFASMERIIRRTSQVALANPENDLIQTPEHVFNSLTQMMEQIIRLSNKPFLSDEAKVGLNEVREAMEKAALILEDEEKREVKNDVDVLLNFDHLPWAFDNSNVGAYRARAFQFPHHQFFQQDLHIPRYFNGGPLPKTTPSSLLANILVAHTMGPKQFQITLTSQDNAISLIARVYDRFESRAEAMKILGDPSHYVLKVIGVNEYMHGTELLYNYEAIRHCLRNLTSTDLNLVKRPEPMVTPESSIRNVQIYSDRVDFSLPVLTADEFTETRAPTIAWDQLKWLPLRTMSRMYKVRIRGVDNVHEAILPRLDATMTHLRVRTFMFHGTQIIKNSDFSTPDVARCQSPRWWQWLQTAEGNMHPVTCQIPRETRVCVLLYGRRPYAKEEDLLAFVNIPLIDQFGYMRSGVMNLKMWPIELGIKPGHLDALTFVFRGTTVENLVKSTSSTPVAVCIEFGQHALPITAPIVEQFREPDILKVGEKQQWKKLTKEVRQKLDALIKMDPLYILTPQDKEIFWTTRHHLLPYPLALPKFLQSVDWTSTDHKNEAHRHLAHWTPPLNPVSALELLDAQYADYKVREYAVNCLRVLPDDELQLFLLQLTQSLKHEPFHDSPLTRFLMERALRNPYSIGHSLFWHFKAELHNTSHCERFAVIMEEYLFHAGCHTADLRKQYEVVQKLTRISGRVVTRKHAKEMQDDEIQAEYQSALKMFNDGFLSKNGSTQIPLNPKWTVTTLIVEKCRYMSSKMAPLWLVFKNADPLGDNVQIMFKSGDDLRQDILTLQLLKVMDKIWVSEDLDMRLIPYTVVSTGVNAQGKGVGLIEIVLNSDTTSGIQLKYGGGAIGALKLDPLQKFIQDHNKDPYQYEKAKDNFIKSCAGYCVATYVLGIGDRHNGNIMLTKAGQLFHIDFGHFLGNFKSKFGIKRERAAFVLTPEMAFVMGGKKYKKAKEFQVFTDLSAQAFTILRNHASLFINLFSLMVSAQMPELMFHEDINYLRDKFFLQDTEKGAVERLRKEIKKSLSTTYRQFDNFIHNFKHGEKKDKKEK